MTDPGYENYLCVDPVTPLDSKSKKVVDANFPGCCDNTDEECYCNPKNKNFKTFESTCNTAFCAQNNFAPGCPMCADPSANDKCVCNAKNLETATPMSKFICDCLAVKDTKDTVFDCEKKYFDQNLTQRAFFKPVNCASDDPTCCSYKSPLCPCFYNRATEQCAHALPQAKNFASSGGGIATIYYGTK